MNRFSTIGLCLIALALCTLIKGDKQQVNNWRKEVCNSVIGTEYCMYHGTGYCMYHRYSQFEPTLHVSHGCSTDESRNILVPIYFGYPTVLAKATTVERERVERDFTTRCYNFFNIWQLINKVLKCKCI